MARFSRITVTQKMGETGVVPVFYHKDLEVCKKVVKACYEGGIRVFEFTNRGDFAHEIFSDLNKFAIAETPEMILGVGSVIDASTATLYIQLGANFIVSPITKEEMAKVCNRRKIAWSPGCGSLTEISKAEELGAEVVKIFPGAQVGGPKFVAAVKGPCPWTSIMPTGGVSPDEDNLKQWFEAGVHCVGMGSKLVSKELIAANDYAKISETCKNALAIVKKYKK
jgi:2-dehydro-3-deoxyphosphogluconate aldolase / (4S)-4-hydroxy-2-oxoglutarate aldolase